MRLCRKLSFDDVLKCSLALTKGEAETLKVMLRMKQPFTINEIANKMNKDRSVAQRHMKKLGEKGVALRFQQNRDEGGYEFVYRTIEKKELRRLLFVGVKQFTSQVETMINEF